MTDVGVRTSAGPAVGPATRPGAGFAAVYVGQLARARVARGPLLFVATVQSLGILALLRGVINANDTVAARAAVAGSTVLVVAFVALNLLAQRFGGLKAGRALDYYAALPVPVTSVVLATAASYATFTVPGALLTAVVGTAFYGLPFAGLWVVVPAVAAAGVAMSGVGAALGLAMPRPELATVAGQLAMTAVLFLGVIPPEHLPVAVQALRDAVPSTYAVDALASALSASPSWAAIAGWLVASVAYGAAGLLVAARLFRRAVAG